jgi:heme/copper-type cytochrome/quinol oxidase subunit 3
MTDAYGSIFYTITSFHAAHLMLGLFMLLYVLALPQIGPGHKPPHRALHNASLYWHFVDFVWVLIVALLYLAPNIGR